MALTVTFDGSNFTLAENADDLNWNDRGGGGASNQDLDYPLEGTECRGRKIGTTRLGMSFSRASIDLSTAGEHIGFWFFGGPRAQMETKANAAISVRLGGAPDPDTAPWSEWDVHGSDTIPATNKYVRVWFDVDRGSPDAFSGTFNANDVESMGGVFIALATPAGNFNTYFIDRIDRMQGSGGLTGTGTAGVFEDFLAFDADTSTNRQGVVERIPGGLQINARVTVGTSASAVLNDSDLTLIFDDQQFCETAFMGLTFDLQNASTDIDLTDSKITSAGSVNIGDLIVSGTSGALDFARVTLDNLRQITLTSACSLVGGIISNSAVLTHGGATIDGVTIGSATTADGVAFITTADPTNIKNCLFSFSDGHAIELTATGTFTFTGNKFSGYGTGNDAAIFNDSGGLITINVAGGGDTPTIRNGAGASTVVNNDTTITLTTLQNNTEVTVYDSGTGAEIAHVENVTGNQFQFTDVASNVIDIFIHHIGFYRADILGFTVPSAATSIPIQQTSDPNYVNP